MFILLTTLIKLVIVVAFVMLLAPVLTWMERRQSAFMQDRIGPNRAYVQVGGRRVTLIGLLHFVADGAKMLFKESFMPKDASKGIFTVAPIVGFVTALAVMALVPFAPDLTINVSPETAAANPWLPVENGRLLIMGQITRIDTGLLFVLAISSLGVYGAALAGWASNNRFALLGGLRAAAQQVSYEIALGLTLVGVLIAFGSTEMSALVGSQSGTFLGGVLPKWGIFYQPLAAVLFLAAAIAETKRGPFDAPEGESEIIGYFVEYSSMSFGLFMLGEFVEIIVLAAVFTTLFLGGWQLPWIMGETSMAIGPWVADAGSAGYVLMGALVFVVKVFLVCAFQLAVRWTLPRFRYDQIMRLGWKNLLPLALVNIFVTAVLVYIDPGLELLAYVGVGMIACFALVVIAGPRRHTPTVAHGH